MTTATKLKNEENLTTRARKIPSKAEIARAWKSVTGIWKDDLLDSGRNAELKAWDDLRGLLKGRKIHPIKDVRAMRRGRKVL